MNDAHVAHLENLWESFILLSLHIAVEGGTIDGEHLPGLPYEVLQILSISTTDKTLLPMLFEKASDDDEVESDSLDYF